MSCLCVLEYCNCVYTARGFARKYDLIMQTRYYQVFNLLELATFNKKSNQPKKTLRPNDIMPFPNPNPGLISYVHQCMQTTFLSNGGTSYTRQNSQYIVGFVLLTWGIKRFTPLPPQQTNSNTVLALTTVLCHLLLFSPLNIYSYYYLLLPKNTYKYNF